MPVTSKPGSKKTTPHSDVIDYDEIELSAHHASAAVTWLTASGAETASAGLPRALFCTRTGGGTLIATTDGGTERVIHGCEAGKFIHPAPCLYASLSLETTAGDAAAFLMSDAGVFADDTTDFNDAGTADVLFMPATEAADADGFMIGMADPFNAVELTLSTVGVGGVIAWKVYTGDSVTYDTAGWTTVTAEGAAKNLLASGDVSWVVPNNWRPVTINSLGPYYWVHGLVTTVFSTNPVGSQGQTKNMTTVGGLRAGF